MSISDKRFQETETLKKLRHFLPAQAPLKDFIHHNTLHAFQHEAFFEGLSNASKVFGYKVTLSLEEYRKMYQAGKISDAALSFAIERKGLEAEAANWLIKLKTQSFEIGNEARVGT